MKRRDDDGSVLVLTIGAVLIGLLTIAVVVDVSRLWLTRRALASLADTAALAGTRGLDLETYYRDGISGSRAVVPLDPSAVRTEIDTHLRRSRAAQRFTNLRVVTATTDGRTVTVTLRAEVTLPRGRGVVTATSTATAPVS